MNGLWSAGGIDARFTKRGKVWVTRGALLAHLAQYLARRYQSHRGDGNWLDYEFINKIGETWDVVEYAQGKANVIPARLYVETNSPAYKWWIEERARRMANPRPPCEVPCPTCRGRGSVSS